MKKKIVALTLVIMMLCSTIFTQTDVVVNAGITDTEPTITVETVNGHRGDSNVIVKVLITNNPGIVSAKIRIGYPAEKLELVSATDEGLLGGWMTPATYKENNPIVITWEDGLAEANTTENGALLTLKFNVKNFEITDSTQFGLADITLTYDNIVNFDVDDVDFQIVNGGINITCLHNGATYKKNEKPASCFEKGYTGDTYCDICDEKIADGTDIKKNDHTPDDEWSYNTTHHWKNCITVGCGNKVSEEEHKGGNKTCTTQAVCSECKQPYGDTAPHIYTVPQKDGDDHWNKCVNCDAIDTKVSHTFDQKIKNSNTLKTPADCDDDAIYYYSCVCGQVSTSLNFVDTGSATNAHKDADGKWETNGTKHWHTCECGKVIDEEDHKGGTATCKDLAACSVCKKSYGAINPNNHTGGTYLKNQKEPQCYEKGYTGDTHCVGCNEKLADGQDIKEGEHTPASVWTTDATHHWKVCEIIACGNKVQKGEHEGGTKTCTEQAVCTVCKVKYGTTAPHSYTVPQKDTEHHWNKCATCSAIDAKIDHNYNQQVKNSSTLKSVADCDNDAVYYYSCACGQISTTLTFDDIGSATSDHKDADNKWETSGKKHWHTCECGKVIDEEDHKGGTKTCTSQAICSVCNIAYGDTAPHTYNVPQKDENNHWNKCANCDATDTKMSHTFDQKVKNSNTLKSVADCDEDAVYYYSCACGQIGTILTFADAGTATNNHKDADNKWETNGTKHWHTCECGKVIDEEEHKDGTATCKDLAICSVCEKSYGSTNADNHIGGTELRNVLSVKCDQDGYTGDTYCKGCGAKIASGEPILKGHKTVKVPYVKETHEKDGNIEYYTCSACDLIFSDEAAKNVITIEDTVIKKGEHSYDETYEKDKDNHWKACACGNVIDKATHTLGDWVITKEATKTEKGCRERICSVCGYKVVEDIPVLVGNQDNSVNSPQTSDHGNLYIWVGLMFVSVSYFMACMTINKRRKQNR